MSGFILSDLSGCFVTAYICSPTQQKAEGQLQDLASVCIVSKSLLPYSELANHLLTQIHFLFFYDGMVFKFSLELY